MVEHAEIDWSDAVRKVAFMIFTKGYVTLNELSDLIPGYELEEIDDFLIALEQAGIVFEEHDDDLCEFGDVPLIPITISKFDLQSDSTLVKRSNACLP